MFQIFNVYYAASLCLINLFHTIETPQQLFNSSVSVLLQNIIGNVLLLLTAIISTYLF